MEKRRIMINATHQVVITISSKDDKPEVNMQVNWDPLLDMDEVEALGFTPAAYLLAENFLMSMDSLVATETLLELEESDLDDSRVVH